MKDYVIYVMKVTGDEAKVVLAMHEGLPTLISIIAASIWCKGISN